MNTSLTISNGRLHAYGMSTAEPHPSTTSHPNLNMNNLSTTIASEHKDSSNTISSSTNKPQNIHQFPSSLSTLPNELIPSLLSTKDNQKHLQQDISSSPNKDQNNHLHSNSHHVLSQHSPRMSEEHKLPSLIGCTPDCDNALLSDGSYKASAAAADQLMSSFGFGYSPATTSGSVVLGSSGLTNLGLNAFTTVNANRKLPPPEGNESCSINEPRPTNEESFSPSPNILQNSPTLASALTSSNSPLHRLGGDKSLHYISPKDVLTSTSSLKFPSNSTHQIQPQQHHQLNPITTEAFSSDMGSQLNPEDPLPTSYPYFTSPTADLSSPYYGSYSTTTGGVFSSKTILQPSRTPRSSKSRSHAGKMHILSGGGDCCFTCTIHGCSSSTVFSAFIIA